MTPDSLADRIDRELASSHEVRSGLSAYAAILNRYEKALKINAASAALELQSSVVGLAARLYRRSAGRDIELLLFSDGTNRCLFDAANDRTVLMYGLSNWTPPGTRDKRYHDSFPRAGDGFDKGHALSHAQGGTDGGPNYFKQKRSVNQRRSAAGHLWRDIETYLAANAGVFAFVRLIYAPSDRGETPHEVEYGVLAGQSQFRVVIFPNR